MQQPPELSMDLSLVPTMSLLDTGVPRRQAPRGCRSDGGIKYTMAAPSTDAVSARRIVPLLS